ncbi:MAG: hypothetical protein ABSA13_09595 [Beijerinckiaceae bacterium]
MQKDKAGSAGQEPKRPDREVLGLDDFTDADIAALENSRPPAEASAFDHELDP